MSDAIERLRAAGFSLPEVAAPVANYVPAIRSGAYVYTAGQLPLRSGNLIQTGKVGVDVSAEEAQELATICCLNGLAAINSIVDLSEIRQIVKVVGFVSSAPGFTGQPAVLNGASNLLGEVFGDAGRHVRSAVGVAELPLNAPVEVELTVSVA